MRFKPRLFWIILIGQLLLLLLILTGFTRLTAGILQHEFEHHMKEDLEKRGRVFSLAVRPEYFEKLFPLNAPEIRSLTETALRTETRLTLIRRDGKVTYDSSSDIKTMDNHAARKEVASALGGKPAFNLRYSKTLMHDRLYYAIPYLAEGRLIGVLRVSIDDMDTKGIYLAILTKMQRYSIRLLIGLILIIAILANRITASLSRLGRAATKIAEGEYSTAIPESLVYEMNQVSETMSYLSYELKKKMEKMAENQKELTRKALVDELTQIGNRRHFESFFEYQWNSSRRNNTPLSLIIMDIDYFKQYNDMLGHPQGDLCLQQLSRILKSSIKRSEDVLARLGGEEFAALLPASSHEKALHLARSIRMALKQAQIPHPDSPISTNLTLSIGVATIIPAGDVNRQELYNRADACLYRAKKAGRDTVKGCKIE